MKRYEIIQIGVGNVGKALAELIKARSSYVQEKYNVELVYKGGFNSNEEDQRALKEALSSTNEYSILVDTTASDKTIPFMLEVLEKGGSVVMSNKKAVTNTTAQYNQLVLAYPTRVFFNTTIGGGLPIIKSLKQLIDAGDEIISIEGCFSGTLSYLCSSMEHGMSYSEAVKNAREQKFTEPDPRDDLSGLDMARKALICARLMGKTLELEDITIEPLYSEHFNDLSVEEFLEAIAREDDYYRMQLKYAMDENKTLRYVACITEDKVQVELLAVDRHSPLGTLKGPENKAVIRTKWYDKYPLVIHGPGAGMHNTAAGLFSDILSVAKG